MSDKKNHDIYSAAFKQFFGKSISEDKAKEILDYFDMADWVKYWKGGEVEKPLWVLQDLNL